MSNEEKRAALHKILDLIIDINGFEERQKKYTGNKPTVFFTFHGHTCTFNVRVDRHGWEERTLEEALQAEERFQCHLDGRGYPDEDTLESIIAALNTLKEGMQDGNICGQV